MVTCGVYRVARMAARRVLEWIKTSKAQLYEISDLFRSHVSGVSVPILSG